MNQTIESIAADFHRKGIYKVAGTIKYCKQREIGCPAEKLFRKESV